MGASQRYDYVDYEAGNNKELQTVRQTESDVLVSEKNQGLLISQRTNCTPLSNCPT